MDFWTHLAQLSLIETERLYLRPITYFDSDAFFEFASDPSQLSFIFPAVATRSESDYLLTHAFLKNPLGCWAIAEKNQQDMIGFIKFENIVVSSASADFGYFLSHKYRGRGYMTEAVRHLLAFSFEDLNLKCLKIVTHKENIASQKVAQATSFSLKRAFKGSDRYTHKVRDYLEYQISKGDYHE
ncbi:acetyltransferase, GNAT family [Streptococcus porcinus]|uniref:GNAT family N-acetyltransferase n=1 Tax=Streptococcus porcinus TaxID=1340 RepID=UPI0010CABB27|nr:GNAT family N-acetyltransferase [Streptococcus porcinus]VTS21054.1 acetyltransferase, GNAT family [Streptococcus porcinus]